MTKFIIISTILALLVLALLWSYLTRDDMDDYVLFATWGTPQEIESFERLVNTYNTTRSPKHKVKLLRPDNMSYDQRLLIQAAAGNMPDVMHLYTGILVPFVREGLIQDLTPFVEQDTSFHLDAFFPNLMEGCKINGRVFAIPHNFSTIGLYYNKDHFDAEGLRYPDTTWTWDSVLVAAKKLTKRGAQGNIIRYGCYVEIALWTMINQNGGEWFNAARDSCIIATPETAEMVQFVDDLAEKYQVSWSSKQAGIYWDDMFAGGRCSMLTNGRWAAAWFVKSMPQGAMDVAPMPS
jgi:multiple sugar transport system substrate-binding protein